MDDWLVDSMSGTALKLHHPVPQETALDFDRPWEGSTSWAPVIDKEGDLYRLWYRAWPKDGKARQAYAESADGVRWERPSLGIVDFKGSTDNNLIWTEPGGNMCPFLDGNPDASPDQRYKGIVRLQGHPRRRLAGRHPLEPDARRAGHDRVPVRLAQRRLLGHQPRRVRRVHPRRGRGGQLQGRGPLDPEGRLQGLSQLDAARAYRPRRHGLRAPVHERVRAVLQGAPRLPDVPEAVRARPEGSRRLGAPRPVGGCIHDQPRTGSTSTGVSWRRSSGPGRTPRSTGRTAT